MHGEVPATYVQGLFEYLDARGTDSRVVLGCEAPGGGSLERVPVTRWRALLERAAAYLGDPLLGLHLGQAVTPAHFGTLGYVFFACENLAAAIDRLHAYERLVYDVNPMRVRHRPDRVTLEWDQTRGRPGPLVDETAITALVQLMRDLVGKRLTPLAVTFINPRPDGPAPYTEYFGCPVRFAEPVTRVVLDANWLTHPLRRPDPTLRALLEREARRRLSALPDADPVLREVREAIIRLARDGRATLPDVAAELNLSERTLHRRLADRDSAFRALREDTLRRVAGDYLADPTLQLSEIALLLGYSEQSAFTRAFRRWTGRTPRAHRAIQTAPPER